MFRLKLDSYLFSMVLVALCASCISWCRRGVLFRIISNYFEWDVLFYNCKIKLIEKRLVNRKKVNILLNYGSLSD